MGMEIERKYLIRMPDEDMLRSLPGCEVWDIVQTYLNDGGVEGLTQRVRSVRCGGVTRYGYTFRRRGNALTCDEREKEVTEAAYRRLLQEANPALRPIEKRRYRVPHRGQLMEIDVYSFWSDRATLEIELESEAQAPELPDWLDVVRELTGEQAYKNRYLAERVPMEEMPHE